MEERQVDHHHILNNGFCCVSPDVVPVVDVVEPADCENLTAAVTETVQDDSYSKNDAVEETILLAAKGLGRDEKLVCAAATSFWSRVKGKKERLAGFMLPPNNVPLPPYKKIFDLLMNILLV
jgi:hypothetical protein